MRKQATKRVPAHHISDKKFKSRIYKEFSKFNNKKNKNSIKKSRANDFNKYFTKDISIAKKKERKKEKSHENMLYIINLCCA